MKRNGKIEIYRFLFCIIVILYHINKDLWDGELVILDHFTFFNHGRTAVEFFFLLSGFLMAQSVYKLRNKEPNISIGNETAVFVSKKIKSVFTPYTIISLITILHTVFFTDHSFEYIVDRAPSLLFLQRTGIGDEGYITVGWYIGSMLLAVAVIYPFLRKFYDGVSLVAAPIVASLSIGALIYVKGALPQAAWGGIIHLANIRAIAVVLLGVFCFRVTLYLREAKLSDGKRILLAVTENLCWIISLLYMVSTFSNRYEGHITYIMAAAISISFSRDMSSKLYNNKVTAYLGRLSLSVYLSQTLIRNIAKIHMPDIPDIGYILFVVFGTLIMGILIDLLVNRRKKA